MPETCKWILKTYTDSVYTLTDTQYQAFLQAVSAKLDFISFKNFGFAIKSISDSKMEKRTNNAFEAIEERKNPEGLQELRKNLIESKVIKG